MHHLIHIFDPFVAIRALLGLAPTDLQVLIHLVDLYAFVTKFTFLRFEFAVEVMVSILKFHRRKIAILTVHDCVLRFFMVLLVCFGHALTTIFTLKVLTCAPHLMHPESLNVNLVTADSPQLGLF